MLRAGAIMVARRLLLAWAFLTMVSACAPAPPPDPQVPRQFWQPSLTIDLPPELDVDPGTVFVSFSTLTFAKPPTPDAPLPPLREMWVSPQLRMAPSAVIRLSDGRTRHAFTAPAARLTELANMPAVRARPQAGLGFGFALCTKAPLPATGPIVSTVHFVAPPLRDEGPMTEDLRQQPELLARISPCDAG